MHFLIQIPLWICFGFPSKIIHYLIMSHKSVLSLLWKHTSISLNGIVFPVCCGERTGFFAFSMSFPSSISLHLTMHQAPSSTPDTPTVLVLHFWHRLTHPIHLGYTDHSGFYTCCSSPWQPTFCFRYHITHSWYLVHPIWSLGRTQFPPICISF